MAIYFHIDTKYYLQITVYNWIILIKPKKLNMKTVLPKLILSYLLIGAFFNSSAQNEPFDVRIVNAGYQLNSAWELTYGPDDSLWVTENVAYKVSKISTVNGGKTELLDLSKSITGFSTTSNLPQGGLMGMVLHPSMFSEWPKPSKPWVYLAYVFKFDGCLRNKINTADSICLYKTKIVRYDYNRSTKKLTNEQVIIQTLNGSSDHNSGRLVIGDVGGTSYLFYSIGDMGTGQYKNAKRVNRSQLRDSLEGKVLRFNLEAIGNANNVNSWIPTDNPYLDANANRTAVWSWGHRNAQGLAFGRNGILYSSEQQDMSDDEINIIEKAGNYGWPLASGYCDGNYNGLTLATLPVISEQADSIKYNLKAPIYTLYTEKNPANLIGKLNSLWPTVACSSIDVYEKPVIPGWSRSILVPSLKAGLIQRMKLDPTGTKVIEMNSIAAMAKFGEIRYRDICISSDGLRIYASADMSSQSVKYKGRILEFTYEGSVLAVGEDSLKKNTRNTQIELYPNPAQKVLNVKSNPEISSPLRYAIYDINGKAVLNGKSFKEHFSINIESLSTGFYVFKLYNAYNLNVQTKKFMVK
jgi:PQQ-dependent dehydrogenase (s-GDH family)